MTSKLKLTLLLSASISASMFAEDAARDHQIDYGLSFASMQQGTDYKTASFSGIFAQCLYSPVNSVFIDTGFDVVAGKIEAKDSDAYGPAKLNSALSTMHLGFGYTVPFGDHKLSPFISRTMTKERSRAKIRYIDDTEGGRVVHHEEKWDIDMSVNTTSIGAQMDIVMGKFAVVPRVAVGRTDGGEIATSVNENSRELGMKNSSVVDLGVAGRFNLTQGFGFYASLNYNNLKLQSNDIEDQKMGSTRLNLGVLHSF